MSTGEITGAAVGLAIFVMGLLLAHVGVDRVAASRQADREGSWQHSVRVQAALNRSRLVANVYYFVTACLAGGALFVAAIARAVAVGWGLFGLLLAVLSAGLLGARLQYGSGSLRDALRVVASWMRRPPS